MSQLFRDFWFNVVGVDKPKVVNLKGLRPRGADDVQDIDQQAEAAEEETERAQAQAAALEEKAEAAEQKAEAAAYKAQIMERLAALVGPYKEAVAANGPGAKRLQTQLGVVRSCIGKQQFTQAAEGLDMLKDLLDEQSPGRDDDDDDDDVPVHKHHKHVEDDDEPSRKHGRGVDDQQRSQEVAATGDKSDVGVHPPTDSLKATLYVTNSTGVDLHLVAEGVEGGSWDDPPSPKIKQGATMPCIAKSSPKATRTRLGPSPGLLVGLRAKSGQELTPSRK
jgi:hypothetical protein